MFLLNGCPKCWGVLLLEEDEIEWVCLNCGKRISRRNIEELMAIDLNELEDAIDNMTRRQEIYRILKRSLERQGYWRNRPRGDPKKGYLLKGHQAHLQEANRR